MSDNSDDVTEEITQRHDRRQETRVSARVDVRFNEPSHAARALRAYSLNFSLGGLCLKTQRKYAVGSVLELSLAVGETEFKLQGVVAWQREGAIGVRFANVSEEDRIRLQTLMEQHQGK